jgi:hypothetical protein
MTIYCVLRDSGGGHEPDNLCSPWTTPEGAMAELPKGGQSYARER